MSHKPVKIEKAWGWAERQTLTRGNRAYDVHAVIREAADLPVEEVPLRHLNIDYVAPCNNTLFSFAQHMKQVLDADMSCPIIIDEVGTIIDGRHRVISALVNDIATIPVKRFDLLPSSCYDVVDD